MTLHYTPPVSVCKKRARQGKHVSSRKGGEGVRVQERCTYELVQYLVTGSLGGHGCILDNLGTGIHARRGPGEDGTSATMQRVAYPFQGVVCTRAKDPGACHTPVHTACTQHTVQYTHTPAYLDDAVSYVVPRVRVYTCASRHAHKHQRTQQRIR